MPGTSRRCSRSAGGDPRQRGNPQQRERVRGGEDEDEDEEGTGPGMMVAQQDAYA